VCLLIAENTWWFFCLNCFWMQAQGSRYKETSNLNAHFSFDGFPNISTIHYPWVHAASILIFPADACLTKLLGIDVQTSSSNTHMFYIHKHFHNSVCSFQILYFDVAWFMWKRMQCVSWPIARATIDLEPKIRTAEENWIILPKKKTTVSVCMTNVRSYLCLFIFRNHLL